MAFLHCNQETRVVETRGIERVRECKVCGLKFKTEEVLKETIPLTPAERREKIRQTRKLLECPINKDELKHMMETFPSMKAIADKLFVSTTTLNRWMREFDL